MSYQNKLTVLISPQAQRDLQDILQYTKETWGTKQKNKYKAILTKGIKNLGETPRIGKPKTEISPNHRVLHIESHLIVYKILKNEVQIVRILHKKMDDKV